MEEVADGVFAYLQPDGGWCLNNAGLVAADGEAMLIDTAATESRTLRLRDAVAAVTIATPGLVVNTHSHGDHTFGNHVFRDGAVIVAHRRCRSEMADVGLHLTTLWPDVRWGRISLALPSLTFSARLTVHVGDVVAELIHSGPAHTTNDAVVWLPGRRVLFAGDLVLSGVTPFVPMGSVAGSLAAIETLRELEPAVVVPGHGPVCGPEALDQTETYLLWLQELAAQGMADGLRPLEAARRAKLGEHAELLDAERLVPNLHRAYLEADGAPPGAPLDIDTAFAEMVEYHGGPPACHA